jgi:hypothetical protein
MQTFQKFFLFPSVLTLASLFLVLYLFGFAAFVSVFILIILEITLSFDNAVVNAKVLEKMTEQWRRRFMNWGIWVAVFGTRVVLPILIVAVAAQINVLEVFKLVMYNPEQYAVNLRNAHYSIGAFGGIFLLLVAMKYFIDDTKEIHWIHKIEVNLKKFASIESVEIIIAMLILLTIGYLTPLHMLEILTAGMIGIMSFVFMNGITNRLDVNMGDLKVSGFALFMYLNLLDVAFSLDGVIGAFAISSNIVIIAIGLGIGAYFVRSFTLMMVEKKTLSELQYLEHGAHWAIFGLAACMLMGLVFHIPEVLTGVIGLVFVAASYVSSVRFFQK